MEAPSEMEAPGTALLPLAKIRGAAPACQEHHRLVRGATGLSGALSI